MTELAQIEKTMSEDVRNCPIPADHLIAVAPVAGPLLSDKQQAAIELLLLGKSVGAIAKAVEVDPRTLYRWRHDDDDFRDELDRRRRELWREAGERLASLVHPALDVLEKHLDERYDRARFRAASTILRLADLRKTIAPDSDE